MRKSKLLVVAAIAILMIAFLAFDLGQYLNLGYFKARHTALVTYQLSHPLATALVFFVFYVAVTGLSLPGAAIMTLAAGAMFGLLWGTVIVSFASSLGATLAFLASRFVLRDWVQRRLGRQLRSINDGVEKEGGFYLFTLRLIPAFPFFAINLLMGLTPIRTWTYYWVSQAGMLAGTIVYVNAGTQLAGIDSLQGILSPGLVVSLSLVGVFPLAAKKIVEVVKARRAYVGWRKPVRFDRNLVVIGAGSAGLVTAYIAAAAQGTGSRTEMMTSYQRESLAILEESEAAAEIL